MREDVGENPQHALLVDSRREYALLFTRAGWSNPLRFPRSTLQRVAYRLDDDVLVRAHWPVLDRALSYEPKEIELLQEVDDVEIRFLDTQRQWHDQWPPLSGSADPSAGLRLRPMAIEVNIDLRDWGRITRLIEVAG